MASVLLARGAAVSRQSVLLVLLLAAFVLAAGAALRSTEYDESYTRLVTSLVPRPQWPAEPFTPASVAATLEATAGPGKVAENLRHSDVHPPLYFWLAGAWRAAGGTSVEALRALSVLLALGAVGAFMAAAAASGLPPLATGLGTALAYGFAYTGGVARGFALAHLLLGLSTLALVLAWRRASPRMAALGGLAAGGASFSNYLAAFPGAALVGWLLITPLPWRDRLRLLVAAALPFLLVQGGNLYFFLAQRDSRPGQFEAFSLPAAAALLAQFNLANLFGGLPLYVEGLERVAVAAGITALFALGVAAVALRWRAIGPTRWLWLCGFVAPSAGLFLLGAMFGNMPIELRYVAFAAPFAAALLAGAAAGWTRYLPKLAPAAFVLVLFVQAVGVVGMALHPATQQTYRGAIAALRPVLGPDTLLLVPRGNDGVGIVGAVLAEAPRDQPLLVLRRSDPAELAARVAPYRRVVLLGITDRDGATQEAMARAALEADRRWIEQATPWRDARRGYSATVLIPGRLLSSVADRAEGAVIGGAHDGREKP
jgi:hypothetical protein